MINFKNKIIVSLNILILTISMNGCFYNKGLEVVGLEDKYEQSEEIDSMYEKILNKQKVKNNDVNFTTEKHKLSYAKKDILKKEKEVLKLKGKYEVKDILYKLNKLKRNQKYTYLVSGLKVNINILNNIEIKSIKELEELLYLLQPNIMLKIESHGKYKKIVIEYKVNKIEKSLEKVKYEVNGVIYPVNELHSIIRNINSNLTMDSESEGILNQIKNMKFSGNGNEYIKKICEDNDLNYEIDLENNLIKISYLINRTFDINMLAISSKRKINQSTDGKDSQIDFEFDIYSDLEKRFKYII